MIDVAKIGLAKKGASKPNEPYLTAYDKKIVAAAKLRAKSTLDVVEPTTQPATPGKGRVLPRPLPVRGFMDSPSATNPCGLVLGLGAGINSCGDHPLLVAMR